MYYVVCVCVWVLSKAKNKPTVFQIGNEHSSRTVLTE